MENLSVPVDYVRLFKNTLVQICKKEKPIMYMHQNYDYPIESTTNVISLNFYFYNNCHCDTNIK